MIAVLLVNAWVLRFHVTRAVYEVSYSEFKRLLNEDNVRELTLRGHEVSGLLVACPARGRFRLRTERVLDLRESHDFN